MFMAWLVLISLSNPNAPPEMVRGYKTLAECYAPANSEDNASIMPFQRTRTPKGKAFVCMVIVYPT